MRRISVHWFTLFLGAMVTGFICMGCGKKAPAPPKISLPTVTALQAAALSKTSTYTPVIPTLTPILTTLRPSPTQTPTCSPTLTSTPTGTATNTPTVTPTVTPTPTPMPAPVFDKNIFLDECWITYSPELFKSYSDEDFLLLRQAGVTGLVTYVADYMYMYIDGILYFDPDIFKYTILGIRDPNDQDELDYAIYLAEEYRIAGYVVGNNGLGKLYDLDTLKSAMQFLRDRTGKPVTTSEKIENYIDPDLIQLGDWVYPNARPNWEEMPDPKLAASWTERMYLDISRRAGDKFVIFKEVGFPNAGDSQGKLSEASQAEYYRLLNKKNLEFVYYDAFDRESETQSPVDSSWGFFYREYPNAPKLSVKHLCSQKASEPLNSDDVFNVYTDAGARSNHFYPTGYMGDIDYIQINEHWKDNPLSGSTAIQVIYARQGSSRNECDLIWHDITKEIYYCGWAGVYWQNPAGNWGTVPNAGYDLSKFTKLTFWARSDEFLTINEFGAGGIEGDYPDSMYKHTESFLLTPEWKKYTIDLDGDLSYVIGGFYWSTANEFYIREEPIIFYLDNIRYEK
jgi:hypothetical protein